MSTQSLSRELATKRPANVPARPEPTPQVINGVARVNPPAPAKLTHGWFTWVVLVLLAVAFGMPLWQQMS